MKRDAIDKVFDVVLDDVAKQIDTELGNSLEEYDGVIEYSNSHKRKMHKLFKAERRKERKNKTLKIIFVSILAVLIIFVSLFVFSEIFRVKFLNTYLELKESINFDFSLTDNSHATYKDKYIELNYVPKGFEVRNHDYKNNQNFYKFKKENTYFQLTLSNENLNSSIDSENSDVKLININDKEVYYFSKNNVKSIISKIDDYYIRLSGNISKHKLIKIAENLKILK